MELILVRNWNWLWPKYGLILANLQNSFSYGNFCGRMVGGGRGVICRRCKLNHHRFRGFDLISENTDSNFAKQIFFYRKWIYLLKPLNRIINRTITIRYFLFTIEYVRESKLCAWLLLLLRCLRLSERLWREHFVVKRLAWHFC